MFYLQNKKSKTYKYVAVGYLFIDDDGVKEIEILDSESDEGYALFEDVDWFLKEEIEADKDHITYFIAEVEGNHVVDRGYDYTEYDVDLRIKELKIHKWKKLNLYDIIKPSIDDEIIDF